MNIFPAICIDNFYSDPDRVREFALSLDYYSDPNGNWPGKRTEELFFIDQDFHNLFCKKIFSIFYDINKINVRGSVKTMFQIIEPYHIDPLSPKNQGWIHYDIDSLFAGVIYLNKNSMYNNGTSLYQLIDKDKIDTGNTKEQYYSQKQDLNYNEKIIKHNSGFIETVKYNNVYNRFICFDSNVAHGANNFFNEKEPRLTQVFFVDEFTSSSESAILRHQRYL